MGLLDDLQRTVDHVGNAVGHAVGTAVGTVYSTVTGDQAGGQRIEHGIDTVSDAVFFDGAVKGTNPALIHKYFNDGPGTKSYGVAEATAKSLQSDYDDYGTRAARVTSLLEQGWSGQAAAQGVQSVQQSQTIAQSMSQHMAAKQSAYSGQMQVFDSTKHSVLPMPDNPPPATNPMSMDVVSTASGAVTAAAYQEGTKANQQAYSNYQPPTQSHASTIPKGDTVSPGQSNPTPGPTPPGGPGISEPRSYNPSFGKSQTSHASTGPQPGNGAQPVVPPQVGNGGGQPSGSPVAPPPIGSGGTSTGVAGYSGPPAGSPATPPVGGYDTNFGSRSGADGGFGAGSVFAGGGFAGGGGFGGSGSGYGGSAGAAGGRGGSLGSGNAAGAGAAEEAMAARAGAAGARGAAGQSGAGAPGAGGRGGKKEEDKEHKTAAYLVTEEHGTEVVGDMPPALPAGGVIGE